jgi:exodeoxyribonuclease V alpha subunit
MSPVSDPIADPIADLLAAGGAPPRLAQAVTATLGPGAAAELSEDPWRLLDVPGVRPDQADAYARARLGRQAHPEDPRRARALVGWLLARAARDGHSALRATTVSRALPAFGFADAEATLAAVVADGAVLAVEGSDGADGGTPLLLALDSFAMAEASLVEGLERLLGTARHLCGPDRGEAFVTGHDDGGAAEVVRAAAGSGVSVAATETAAATAAVVAGLVRLADAAGRRLLVAAATARAARYVRDVSGASVTTPRDLLTQGGEVAADLVLVTESGMLDLATAAALVELLADGAHLVLAGDPSGLASPGPGLVLADLVDSGTVPVNRVPERSGDEPGATLARLAAGVRSGSLPRIDPADREVVVVPARDAGEATHRAVQLVADSIPRALGIPVHDILVVTPRRSGAAGADAINAACKRRLNPGPGAHAGFDPGDRVVVTSGAFPGAPYGEVGQVVTGTPNGGLELEFGSVRATASAADLVALRHGWAVTVRQAPAASWPAVVAVFPGEAAGSLSRPLVLSAVTAARTHLSVVHAAGPALALAVTQAPQRRRVTQRMATGSVPVLAG